MNVHQETATKLVQEFCNTFRPDCVPCLAKLLKNFVEEDAHFDEVTPQSTYFKRDVFYAFVKDLAKQVVSTFGQFGEYESPRPRPEPRRVEGALEEWLEKLQYQITYDCC
jgi:hypothetical protein